MHIRRTIAVPAILLPLLLLALAGCSDDPVTAPDGDGITVEVEQLVADPLDDVLKSTDGTTPPEPADRLARLAEVLGLTDDQLADLAAAYTTFHTGVRELRDAVRAGDLTITEAREEARLLREDFLAAIQLILDARQWDLLQEMRTAADGPPRAGHQQRQTTDRWDDWLEAIGADEIQTAAVLEALEEMLDAVADVRDRVALDQLTKLEACELIATIRADFESTLREILTEEQYQALLLLRPI